MAKKNEDVLGNVLGSPFKWLGGDLPAQVIGRIALGAQGMDPMKEPYPNFFGELSDSLVRPGTNAGKDFIHTWVSPLGGFYDNTANKGKGGYNFNAADPADLGLSALTAIPILGKAAKGARIAAGMPKLNKVSKAVIREKMSTPAKTSVLDKFKTGYKSTATPGGVR